jgi:hypothetical protein
MSHGCLPRRAVAWWAILKNPPERRRLLRSALKDVARIFIVALVLDTTYQVVVLRAFYVVQW